ncbi:hypothetical protein LOC71_09460 [Rhodopirellula sp. JC740]|uniref:Uncharacterized protein n=1 Tax=Rhodopirellula halodulae TaxID=2894198 RepID=A0ABS8NG39_9BACT|nr:hypothetical protein [Rhodopirellula sp. JC740]MCC9642501.1 hypothetical protein [Rhodopirellula sp. JC740]
MNFGSRELIRGGAWEPRLTPIGCLVVRNGNVWGESLESRVFRVPPFAMLGMAYGEIVADHSVVRCCDVVCHDVGPVPPDVCEECMLRISVLANWFVVVRGNRG